MTLIKVREDYITARLVKSFAICVLLVTPHMPLNLISATELNELFHKRNFRKTVCVCVCVCVGGGGGGGEVE